MAYVLWPVHEKYIVNYQVSRRVIGLTGPVSVDAVDLTPTIFIYVGKAAMFITGNLIFTFSRCALCKRPSALVCWLNLSAFFCEPWGGKRLSPRSPKWRSISF